MSLRRIWLMFTLLLTVASLTPVVIATPETQGETLIKIQDLEFDPPLLSIAAGTAVTWQNQSDRTRDLVSVEGLWRAVPLAPGASYTRTFAEPGTYTYYAVGPEQTEEVEMTGTIVVKPAEEAEVPVAGTGGMQEVPELLVLDQQSDGQRVVIQEVNTDQNSFVVIHEPGADDLPNLETSLGRAVVDPGTSTALPIVLDRPVADGQRLFAVLHMDAGTPGVYEYPGPDEPIRFGDDLVSAAFILNVPAAAPTPTPVPPAGPDDLPTTGAASTTSTLLVTEPTPLVWMVLGLGVLLLGSAFRQLTILEG